MGLIKCEASASLASPDPGPDVPPVRGASMQVPPRVIVDTGVRRRKHACNMVARVLSCFCWVDSGCLSSRQVTAGVPLAVCYWLLVSTRCKASVRV